MGFWDTYEDVEPESLLSLILGPGAKMSEDRYWPVSVLMALCVWAVLYFMLNWHNPFCSYEWNVRIVTLVHAITITLMSGYSVFVEGPWPFTDPAGENTILQHAICVVALGYFLFDLCWCLYFKTEGPVMVFHHFLSILGNCVVLWRGTNGCEMIATLFGTEIANPLLQIRWFLRNSNHRAPYSRPLAFVEFSFLGLFVLMRIIIGSYLLYTYLSHPETDWFTRMGAVLIYFVGYLFLFSLLSYTLRKYTRLNEWWRKRMIERQEREARLREEQEEEEAYKQECRERDMGATSSGGVSGRMKPLNAESAHSAASNSSVGNRGILDLTDQAKFKQATSKPSYMKCDLSHDRPSLNEVMSAVPSHGNISTMELRETNHFKSRSIPDSCCSKSLNGLHHRSANTGLHL